MQTETIEPPTVVSASPTTKPKVEHQKDETLNVPRIVSAGLSGLAGGAVAAIVIVGGGFVAALAGSLVGAAITGGLEYTKERNKLSDKN